MVGWHDRLNEHEFEQAPGVGDGQGKYQSQLPFPSPDLPDPGIKLRPIKSERPSNHLILCCPLLLLPSIFPSIGVFSNESTFHIMERGNLGTERGVHRR